jgi:hypothetical protein
MAGKDISVVLYVDGLLILSPWEKNIQWLIDELKCEYEELSIETVNDFSYPGIVLQTNGTTGAITLRMDGYIDNILEASLTTDTSGR